MREYQEVIDDQLEKGISEVCKPNDTLSYCILSKITLSIDSIACLTTQSSEKTMPQLKYE